MRTCPHCKQENQEDAIFCSYCGSSLLTKQKNRKLANAFFLVLGILVIISTIFYALFTNDNPQLKVISSTFQISGTDYVEVKGKVQNISNQTIQYGQVEFIGFDVHGNQVAIGDGYIDSKSLPPNGISTFTFYVACDPYTIYKGVVNQK